ncbi:MAG: ABC transporter substrate-binding protein [Clostridia bacterium]|nr:ABC transporter substrate-binding protein [Clostridia bacterium]
MNKIVKIVLLFIVVVLVATTFSLVLLNDSKEGEIAKERTVVINYNPDNYASSVFQIAKEKGIFEKYLPEDVKIEWTTLTSASDIRDSMVAGDIDIGTPGIMAYMTAIDNDMPLTIMSFYGYATVKAYTNQENINSIADFNTGDQISISGLASNPQAAYLAALKEDRIGC